MRLREWSMEFYLYKIVFIDVDIANLSAADDTR